MYRAKSMKTTESSCYGDASRRGPQDRSQSSAKEFTQVSTPQHRGRDFQLGETRPSLRLPGKIRRRAHGQVKVSRAACQSPAGPAGARRCPCASGPPTSADRAGHRPQTLEIPDWCGCSTEYLPVPAGDGGWSLVPIWEPTETPNPLRRWESAVSYGRPTGKCTRAERRTGTVGNSPPPRSMARPAVPAD
jgi:hypothetical protein